MKGATNLAITFHKKKHRVSFINFNFEITNWFGWVPVARSHKFSQIDKIIVTTEIEFEIIQVAWKLKLDEWMK